MSLVICPSVFLLTEGGLVLASRQVGVEVVSFENLAYIPGQILQSKGGRMDMNPSMAPKRFHELECPEELSLISVWCRCLPYGQTKPAFDHPWHTCLLRFLSSAMPGCLLKVAACTSDTPWGL